MTSLDRLDRNRYGSALSLMVVLAAVMAVYWPVRLADFVWDDRLFLHDTGWLRDAPDWFARIFQPLLDSKNYFRPLGLLAFVGETRLFGVVPGPLHLVSVGMHLANAVLVWLLAGRILSNTAEAKQSTTAMRVVGTSVYALHPLLIEPVAWVCCQFELIATFFMLLGTLFNLTARNGAARIVAVAICFFLAACAKESAVSFPLLLIVVDLLRSAGSGPARNPAHASRFWRDQLPVYAAMALGGTAYLVLRRWGLGYLVAESTIEPFELVTRLQAICYTYVTYWKILLWPMQELGPLHLIADGQFANITPASVAVDVGAFGLLLLGAYQLWKRTALGGLIAAVTAAFIPVLHVFPILFDDSFYHNRFAMTPLAVAAAFLPAVIADFRIKALPASVRRISWPLAACWLVLAAVNIRATLPLWSNEILLWRWVLHDYPDSTLAQVNLLGQYIEHGDLVPARTLAQTLRTKAPDSTNGMLNIAQLAVLDGDTAGAAAALEDAGKAMGTAPDRVLPYQVIAYIKLTGDVRKLQGDLAGAEEAYRDAIARDPLVPATHISLGVALALEGKLADARAAAEAGFAILAPDERARQRRLFDQALREASGATRLAPGN